MNVAEAVRRRMSVRAFLPDPIEKNVVEQLIVEAGRAPSGGNLQPWHVHVVTGEPLRRLLSEVADADPDATPGYRIYPEKLSDPYRTRRFETGEQLYSTLSLAREDKAGRLRHLARNFRLFDAPVGIFVLVDRGMGPPQWADLGMFLQNIILLAVERGFDTCPQEAWALYAKTVERVLDAPAAQMLFCGVALGKRDPEAAVNRLATTRAPTGEWLTMRGFA